MYSYLVNTDNPLYFSGPYVTALFDHSVIETESRERLVPQEEFVKVGDLIEHQEFTGTVSKIIGTRAYVTRGLSVSWAIDLSTTPVNVLKRANHDQLMRERKYREELNSLRQVTETLHSITNTLRETRQDGIGLIKHAADLIAIAESLIVRELLLREEDV